LVRRSSKGEQAVLWLEEVPTPQARPGQVLFE